MSEIPRYHSSEIADDPAGFHGEWMKAADVDAEIARLHASIGSERDACLGWADRCRVAEARLADLQIALHGDEHVKVTR